MKSSSQPAFTPAAPSGLGSDRKSLSAVWTAPGKVTLEKKYVPVAKADEITVQVQASGLCGTDLHIVAGEYPDAHPGVVLGHEYAGVVVEAGTDVRDFRVGDRVTVDPNIPCHRCHQCRAGRPHLCERLDCIGSMKDGGLAEYTVVPVQQAYRVPDELPIEAASLTEPMACALHAVDRAGIRSGSTALVIGAGPIGLMTTALALAAGATTVLVSEAQAARRARIEGFGGVPIAPDEIRPGMADVVLECAGSVKAMLLAVDAARPGSTIVWVGVVSPHAELSLKPYGLFRRELALLGTFTNPQTMERALRLLASGRVNWPAIISHRFPLSRLAEAWAVHKAGTGLKVCLTP